MKWLMVILAIILSIASGFSSLVFLLSLMGGPESSPRWIFAITSVAINLLMQGIFCYSNKNPEYRQASVIFLIGCFITILFFLPGILLFSAIWFEKAIPAIGLAIIAFVLMGYNMIVVSRQIRGTQK